MVSGIVWVDFILDVRVNVEEILFVDWIMSREHQNIILVLLRNII